jgi:hypothetical protein
MRTVNLFRSLIFTIIAFSFSILNAANYYWVGGTGNWSQFATHWAKSSGGSTFYTQAPTLSDNVVFDSNSFTAPAQAVTIDVMANCNNFTCKKVPIKTGIGGINQLTLNGSISLCPGISFLLNSMLTFSSDTLGNTLNFKCDTVFVPNLSFNGAGEWTFLSDFIMPPMAGGIMVQKGTVNTNGKTITVQWLNCMGGMDAKLLKLGNSTLNLGNFNMMTPAQLQAGTSTINLESTFLMGGYTYHNVNFKPTMLSQVNIQGNNTFHNLTFNNNVYAVYFEGGKTQTVNDIKVVSSCTQYVLLCGSPWTDEPAVIKKFAGIVSLDYVSVTKITVIGGASFISNNSNNLGNVINWTINSPTSKNFYWIGGTGNWSDPAHWSNTSGGLPGTCIPSVADNVFFNINSFSAPGQITTIDYPASCKNMDWTGIIKGPTLTGVSDLYVAGSLILDAGMTYSHSGSLYFIGSGVGNKITTIGKILGSTIVFDCSGDYTLQDVFTTSNQINIKKGTVNTNGKNVTCSMVQITNLNHKCNITLGASTITIGNWFVNDTSGLKLNAGSSTINLNNGGTFSGSGLKYYNLTLGANRSLYLSGSNTFNVITLGAGSTTTIVSGTDQTITGITAAGNCNNMISILSSSDNQQSTFSCISGTLNTSFLRIKDSKTTGGAIFNAANSIDLGDNSGWVFTGLIPRTMYWVGNSGNWNQTAHWAISSGGAGGACLPTEVDSVVFDDNSFVGAGQTVTINTTAVCKSMVWVNTANQNLSGNLQTINIYGSLVLNNNVTIAGLTQSYIYFKSTKAGNIINTANKIVNDYVYFDGSGSWKLTDSLRLNPATYYLYFNKGNLNTNGYSIWAYCFYSFTNSVRKIDLTSARIVLTDLWHMSDSTKLTIVPGTSTIVSGATTFYGAYQPYNNVYLSINTSMTIYGGNTYNTLKLPNVKNILFEKGTTQTFTTLTIPGGTNCSNYIGLSSTASGSVVTFKKTAGAFTGNWLNILDIKATGGATFTANNSIGSGDVTGWTFVPSLSGKKVYWVGGTGNWSSPAHWSLTSGGAPTACLPTGSDSVIFDVNSFTALGQIVTVDLNADCKYMDWTGAKFNPTLAGFSTLLIAGTFKLISAMDISYTGTLKLTGTGIYTINTMGKNLQNLEISASGDYSLADSISLNNFYFTSGTFRTNNYLMRIGGFGQFSSNGNAQRKLYLGSSTLITPTWQIMDSSNLLLNAGTSTIIINGGWSFTGAYKTYNNVTIRPQNFGGTITINGSNTFNNLTLSPGADVILEAGKTQTVTQLVATGKSGSLVSISSSMAGTLAEINKVGGTYCGDYMNIRDSKATGASFYAGGNSVNGGNNTGWTFNSFTAYDQYPSTCESPVGSGSKSGVDLTALNNAVNGGTANPVTWYNDAGLTSLVSTPTNITVTDGKIYYAKVTSGGCSTSAIVRYSVLASPIAKDQHPEVCEDSLGKGNMHGANLTLLKDSITGGAPVLLSWFNDYACTSPVVTPANVVVTNAKKFYAKVDNGTCTNIATVTFAVIAWPIANNHNPSICEDLAGSGKAAGVDLSGFDPIITGGALVSVAWYNDTTCATPVVKPDSVTINDGDKFFAKVTNATGCENIGRLLCTVSGSIATTDQVKNICETTIGTDTAHIDLTQIEPFIAGGIPATFKWFRDTAKTDTIKTPANLKVVKRDTFYVNVISGICNGKAKATYIVNSLPVLDLGADKSIWNTDSITLDAGAGFTKYSWSILDTTQTIKVVGSVVTLGIHKYSVTVTNASGCSSTDSVKVDVKVKLGIEIPELSMAIYPNPASDRLNILINGATERVYQLQLFSISGQLLFDRILEAQESNILQTLDVTMYPGGIYLMVIKSDQTVKTVKIMLEK